MVPLLYAAALAVVSLYGFNLFVLSLCRLSGDRLVDGPVPGPDATPIGDMDWPTVTIQLPLYNEPLVARRLVDACCRLRYPESRIDIQVLDDSNDDTVGVVAAAVRTWRARGARIVHLRRTQRSGFKAGALEEGLRVARGSLVALFDADFVPDPDFLLRTVPKFRDPAVGMVQARWGHLNRSASMLTRLQAFGLDTHFAIEQSGRSRSGCFIAFNGTAGVWRTEAIQDAGGWSSDTLTEDLDLSYRAQLKGWTMVYDEEIQVPAELPVEMAGFRSQQRRWTMGSVQTARKLIGAVLSAPLGLRVRWEGVLHLSANLVYPFVLLLVLLHAPLGLLEAAGEGPGRAFFAVLGLGLIGFAGFASAQLTGQRALHADWLRRMADFPVFLTATVGLALQNTIAVGMALAGRTIPFERTPKFDARGSEMPAWWRAPHVARRMPALLWAEMILAGYASAGMIALVAAGAWAFVPFQAAVVVGTWLVPGLTWRHVQIARRTRTA